MVLTKKFLLFELNHGAFMDKDAAFTDSKTDIQDAAIYAEKSATERKLDMNNEKEFLQIPLTKEFIDSLPFELADTAPDVAHSESIDMDTALASDFVVLTDMGFYDEKYNSSDNTSRPKVRSFELDYANLYNMDILQQLGTKGILKAEDGSPKPIIVPVSEVQQNQLRLLDEFSPEKEPHGFFMKPIGETEKQEEEFSDLEIALNDLASETNTKQL